MSKESFEELKIFVERGLAGVMEAQVKKVPMFPRHPRLSRKHVPIEPQL